MTDRLTEDQRDCLQELSNIAMGQAGDSLARFLEVFVHLSVPQIQLLDTKAVTGALRNIEDPHKPITAVGQSFYDSHGRNGLHGEAIVIFSQSSADVLSKLLAEQDCSADEGLLDIANILVGACLNGLAEQLESEFNYAAPTVIGHGVSCASIFETGKLAWNTALLIEINYTFEEHKLCCNLVLIMPDRSVNGILNKIDEILAAF